MTSPSEEGGASPELKCSGTNQDGSPCGAPPELINPSTGVCRSHDPNLTEARREDGRRGARAAARKKGLTEDELPPLTDAKAAERWCEVIGRAIAVGRIPHTQGQAVMRSVSEFLRASEAGSTLDRIEELQTKLEQLQAGAPLRKLP